MFYGKVEELKTIDLNKLINQIIRDTSDKGAGGIVSFIGYVKGIVDGKRIRKLIYEAYEPYASRKLNEIANDYIGKNGITSVVILHNFGTLLPGDPTIFILVSATSRSLAFDISREILERVKKEPPIFKLETRDDGEYWVLGGGERIKREGTI